MSYVLIIDESKEDREIIIRAITSIASGTNVRCVEDAYSARDMIAKEDPFLIILDVDLPRMSGGEFLGHLMRYHPLPVIVVTHAMNADSDRIEKLQLLGAIQTLYKPNGSNDQARFVRQFKSIFETVLSVRNNANQNRKSDNNDDQIDESIASGIHPQELPFAAASIVIALGASTGGPVAISEVVRHFSANSPPILIAQHISDRFLQTLVQGLQRLTDMRVAIAEEGMQVASGRVYLAPPEHHMEMDRGGRIKLLSTVATDKIAPSINILFNSLARSSSTTVIAALLTGMGNDGADGLLRLRRSGATTIAEHRSTCVVYGMPARAAEIGAAAEVLQLPEIGPRIVEHVTRLSELKQTQKTMASSKSF